MSEQIGEAPRPEERPYAMRAETIPSSSGTSAPPGILSESKVALLILLALGVFGLRLPALHFDVLNVDEAVYQLMGAAWLAGTPPHLGIVDNKPLGLYLIHAFAQVAFTDAVAGARILGAIATFATSCLLMQIARRFLGLGRSAGLVCGLLFSTYAILLGGDASQGPVFYAPLLAGGAWLIMAEIEAVRRDATPSLARLGGAGLLLGLSLQIKYVTVFECAAFGGSYLYTGWRANRSLSTLAGAAVLMAGGLLPTAAVYGAYVMIGHGQEFIFYTFVSNFSRAVTEDPINVVASRVALIAIALMPLLLLSLEHLRVRAGDDARRQPAPGWVNAFLAAWFAAAMAGGISQLQFFDHYFYEAMLPLAIMAAAALRPVSRTRAARKAAFTTSAVVLGLGVVGYAAVRLMCIADNGPPTAPSRIARDIESSGAHSMYVFNYHSLLHFLSGIPLPTRYPLPAHLLLNLNADMFKFDASAEIERILGDNPEVIVVDRPLSPHISQNRREMLAAKLLADYCLWRTYPVGPHHTDVYMMRRANLGAARDACATPRAPDEWVSGRGSSGGTAGRSGRKTS